MNYGRRGPLKDPCRRTAIDRSGKKYTTATKDVVAWGAVATEGSGGSDEGCGKRGSDDSSGDGNGAFDGGCSAAV